jgi:putative transcriptional regulator
MIAHHPSDELLLAHASGSSDEATSLIVATHLALCPACRRKVAKAEFIGGALLSDVEPAAMSGNALDSVLSRLDKVVQEASPVRSAGKSFVAPEPLRSYLGGDIGGVKWRSIVPGISYRPLFRKGGADARLIRSRPGHGVGVHTHHGEEFTLCLAGGYTDQTGTFARGDLQTADPSLSHRPMADEGEDCIVLAVSDAPLKFQNGAIGLLAKFFGF